MMPRIKRGYILIIVAAFLTIASLAAWVVVGLGCGEILQTRNRNDTVSAYYAAVAGAEFLYARLKSVEGQIVSWPQTLAETDVRTLPSGGTTVGTVSAVANTVAANIFGIASEGVVNGRRATVVVKYGMDNPFTNGYPLGSAGSMTLTGNRWLIFRSWVRAEGPIASGGSITSNNYVQVSGATLPNQPFAPPSFWYKWDSASSQWISKLVGDTDGNGIYLTDVNHDGKVTIEDAGGDEDMENIFALDNTYSSDSEINDKDAFYTYYTHELNEKENLQIGEGQSNHYNGNQNFGPSSIASGTRAIFVDGETDILFNNTQWWAAASNHTIISMGDITILQPTNGVNDTLTLISYGDIATGGLNVFGGINGNLVVYSHGDFDAFYGGSSNGTIFADGTMNIDTVYPVPFLLNRNLNKGTVDWANPANWPLGLPPNYNRITLSFSILNEITGYKPRMQRK
ncbi:MAG: hypothetical protein JXB40_03325 [Candidatus Omnitrophica bacterium]|nr:hypothetical protein [Candidatus Omnitrophota bacterium]